MPKGKGRQRKRIRKRSWSESDVDAVTHERRRVRGRESGIAAPVEVAAPEPEEQFSDIEPNGVVVTPYGLLAFVEYEGEDILCRVDDVLTDGKTSILAPGDRVLVEFDDDLSIQSPRAPGVDAECARPGAVVRAVAHRTSKLSRPAVGRTREQVIAANVDYLVIVASVARPVLKPGFIDRCLITGQIGDVEPLICINKTDLGPEPGEVSAYREAGLPVFDTSCVTGEGIDTLAEVLKGKLSVLAGHSGVGKSSLINAMDPRHHLETSEVSDSTHKGRHTTTFSKLYHLANGVNVIDTPGMKQLGLWKVTVDELDYYFPELARHAPECKFRDCTHIHEPECGVRQAVESGDIAASRYGSYLRIRKTLEEAVEAPSHPRDRDIDTPKKADRKR